MREKIYRFMMGRYGNDSLNYYLIGAYLVCSLFFSKFAIINILGFGCFIFAIYRMMSKDIYRRRTENENFMRMIKPLRQHFKALKNNFTDKQRKYFVCPKCNQVVRVPRHRGKIEISCPSCRNKFVRKS